MVNLGADTAPGCPISQSVSADWSGLTGWVREIWVDVSRGSCQPTDCVSTLLSAPDDLGPRCGSRLGAFVPQACRSRGYRRNSKVIGISTPVI